MSSESLALLHAILGGGSGGTHEYNLNDVALSAPDRARSLRMVGQLVGQCEQKNRSILPRVRYWARAIEDLGDCTSAEQVDAVFQQHYARLISDIADMNEPAEAIALRDLFYNSVAHMRFHISMVERVKNDVKAFRAKPSVPESA